MKQWRSALLLVCVVLTWAPAVVCAQGDAEARRALRARYDQFDRAYMKKDFKTVGAVFAPDCLLKLSSENRSMSASRVVKGMQSMSGALTVTHAKTRIVSIKSVGNGYEVVAAWSCESKYAPPKALKDDPARQAKAAQTYRDVWKKTGKSWQIVQRMIEESDEAAEPGKK